MSDHLERLKKYLASRGQSAELRSLTADASTREYFRIMWDGKSAIACVYPEPFDAAKSTYLDVTRLFLAAGLPVAAIIDVDGEAGVIVQEDLGDRIVRDCLIGADEESRSGLLDHAIALIARIQAATSIAFDMNSIASRLEFDTEKLLWELDFFKTHYFETYLRQKLAGHDAEQLTAEFRQLAESLASRATVLCHRDFHAANLMLDHNDRMRIIDHQDARIGSPTYDLVSLLLDRITEPPPGEWLAAKRRVFLDEREKLGLAGIDQTDFADEFRLQTIQRCLKAAGTFSFQSATRGKTYFIPFIKPMFEIVLRAVSNLDRFPVLRRILQEQVEQKESR